MSAETAKTPRIFGTKVIVTSLIWVMAWKTDTSMPMTSDTMRIGAATSMVVIRASCASAMTCASFIRTFQSGPPGNRVNPYADGVFRGRRI